VSTVLTLANSMAEDIVGFSDGGCPALEVWLTKLEDHVRRSGADDIAARLADRGLRLVAAAGQGGLLITQGDARRAAFDQFKHRLELCQRFGIPVMVIMADTHAAESPTDIERAIVSIADAARWAAAFNVRIALEFLGTAPFINNLATAITIVESLSEPNLGICLDAFHFYRGPSKECDLARLTPATLAHVQLSDVAGVPRESMTDADRVLPGEGDFDLAAIVATMKRLNYAGAVSFESNHPVFRHSKISQVAELAMTALTRTLAAS
jgi:2-keto-myo-inositol isomerase